MSEDIEETESASSPPPKPTIPSAPVKPYQDVADPWPEMSEADKAAAQRLAQGTFIEQGKDPIPQTKLTREYNPQTDIHNRKGPSEN